MDCYKEENMISEAYKKRCIKQLEAWGAPLEGWRCVRAYDACDDEDDSTALVTCELCHCPRVRYVHVMRHTDYFEDVEVGCICAGIMEGDILAAKKREDEMKKRVNRRLTFINHPWRYIDRHRKRRTYKGHKLEMYRCDSGVYYVSCDNHGTSTYKGKKITDELSAMYAAFNLADPVEQYYE